MNASNLFKGMIGGFVATLVLSGIMVMKSTMGVMPQFDMTGLLANMTGGSRAIAWIVHFLIGTVLWGGLFAWLDPYLPSQSHWSKGLGLAAWLPMMIVVMPMAGAGLFAVKLGMMVMGATLMLHALFGAIMGAVYGAENPAPSVPA